jgi:hypothetical protein
MEGCQPTGYAGMRSRLVSGHRFAGTADEFVEVAADLLCQQADVARWLADGRASTLANRPESHFPVAVVAGHGLFAVATVLLVLLTVLGVAGS